MAVDSTETNRPAIYQHLPIPYFDTAKADGLAYLLHNTSGAVLQGEMKRIKRRSLGSPLFRILYNRRHSPHFTRSTLGKPFIHTGSFVFQVQNFFGRAR